MFVNRFKNRYLRLVSIVTALAGVGIASIETPVPIQKTRVSSERHRPAGGQRTVEQLVASLSTDLLPARNRSDVNVLSASVLSASVSMRGGELDPGWSGLSDKRGREQEMQPPTEPGHFALAQLGTMTIPIRPEAGRVKIDMFIAARSITMKGMVGEGNDRGFDPQAPFERSKAVIELDFTSGIGTVYVAPSCFMMGAPVCVSAYEFSDNGDKATNQFAYSVDESGIHFRYSLENAAADNFRQPFRWLAEQSNPSIDGKISVIPDPALGWSLLSLKGDVDPFPSLAGYQFHPDGRIGEMCELPESSKGVGALRDDQINIEGICLQLQPGMSVGSK